MGGNREKDRHMVDGVAVRLEKVQRVYKGGRGPEIGDKCSAGLCSQAGS